MQSIDFIQGWELQTRQVELTRLSALLWFLIINELNEPII
mgnify:CR=1 FL=1